MSLSLIGLIAFQAYWIYKIGKEKADEFNDNVAEALAEVAKSVEEKETFLFINRFVNEEENVQAEQDAEIIIQYETSSSINSRDSGPKEKTTYKFKRRFNHSSKDLKSIYSNNNSNIQVKVLGNFLDQRKNLSESIDKMAMEYAFKNKDLKDRLEGINLDSLISKALKNQGIYNSQYSYAVIDQLNDSIIYGHKAFSNAKYKVPIFAKTNAQGAGLLAFSASEKATYVFKSILPSLIVSSILILIMITTFGYTLKSIYKQKKISRIKADFINNMTHEFKTPVATISLAIDSMLHPEVKKNDEELEKYGQIIKKENLRMNEQVERLLEMALFDRKELKLNNQSIDCHQLIQELKEDFSLKTKAEDGLIQLNLMANQSAIIADRLHFYNALRNIVDNGIKYSKSTFKIQIETSTINDQLKIVIRDSGIGMNSDTLKRIFDRFYRKPSGNIHNTKGFGLGLAYTKEILEKMGASIGVKSTLGNGSEFTINIPLELNDR